MTAYVLAEVEVTEPESAADYRRIAAAAIDQYGGRYLVRNEVPEPVEGEWPAARRVVLLEFDTIERARDWYSSDAYAPGIKVAQRAMIRRIALLPGPVD